jgi:hypothetical protein
MPHCFSAKDAVCSCRWTADLVDLKDGLDAVANVISVATDGRARCCGRPAGHSAAQFMLTDRLILPTVNNAKGIGRVV